jgi:hypothetical protein
VEVTRPEEFLRFRITEALGLRRIGGLLLNLLLRPLKFALQVLGDPSLPFCPLHSILNPGL